MKKVNNLLNQRNNDNFVKLWNGCSEYREQIFMDNYYLAYFSTMKYMKKYSINMKLFKDVINTSCIALLNAIDTFDLKYNVPFSVYADTCIRNIILSEVLKLKRSDISLDVVLKNQYDESPLAVNLIDERVDIEKEVINFESYKELYRILYGLNEKDRKIIMSYYGFYSYDNPKTLEEVGNENNVSRQRIYEIINEILTELKDEYMISDLLKYKEKTVKCAKNGALYVFDEEIDKIRESDYYKVLINYLSGKEAIIGLLRIGYLNKRHYTSKRLSEMFNTSVENVICIARECIEIIKYKSELDYEYRKIDVKTLNNEYLILKNKLNN